MRAECISNCAPTLSLHLQSTTTTTSSRKRKRVSVSLLDVIHPLTEIGDKEQVILTLDSYSLDACAFFALPKPVQEMVCEQCGIRGWADKTTEQISNVSKPRYDEPSKCLDHLHCSTAPSPMHADCSGGW